MDVDVDGCVIGFSVRLICFCFQVEGDVEVVHYFEVRLHGDLQAEFPEDVNDIYIYTYIYFAISYKHSTGLRYISNITQSDILPSNVNTLQGNILVAVFSYIRPVI